MLFKLITPLVLTCALAVPAFAADPDHDAAAVSARPGTPPNPPRSSIKAMQVAAVQIDTSTDIDTNTRAIVDALASEAEHGTRLVAFEECALTSYETDAIAGLSQDQIDAALRTIAEACRKHDIYAVVGAPYRENDKWYNAAYVFDANGQLIKRYAKLHVVKPDFFQNGDRLAIFMVDDVPTTVMVCHDERYPEIFRIPVLGGAKFGIYISCESKTPAKWDNYRSQIMARAVENQISVLHCNTADLGDAGGSHGHSRIFDPRGNILAEASNRPNQAIRAVIHPEKSSNTHVTRGANSPATKSFWAEGLRLLQRHNPDYFAERQK